MTSSRVSKFAAVLFPPFAIEILPEQITDYKVNYHKNYLVTWLDNNELIDLSINDIWKIREQCIQDLADN